MKRLNRLNIVLLMCLVCVFIFMGGCSCIGCGTLNYKFYDIRYANFSGDTTAPDFNTVFVYIYRNRVMPCVYKPYIKLYCKDKKTRNAFYSSHHIEQVELDEQSYDAVYIIFKVTYSKGCKTKSPEIIYEDSSDTLIYVPSLNIFLKSGLRLTPSLNR